MSDNGPQMTSAVDPLAADEVDDRQRLRAVLAAIGAEATIAVGNTEADRRVAAVITAATGTDSLRVAHLDLAEWAFIARFADESDGQLDILVDNAGGILPTTGPAPTCAPTDIPRPPTSPSARLTAGPWTASP